MLNFFSVFAVVANMGVIQPVIIQTPELELELTPRTPDQMGSFYEARGFPENMLNIIRQQCYITVGITNHSNQRIWLDLSSWEFSAGGKILKREHRDYWKTRWKAMNIPLSKQSTFRWTLLPETLDYLPGEREGGNILLPFTRNTISLTATFATGDDKQGKKITIITDTLFCAEDAE
jgi:hypothetical protein